MPVTDRIAQESILPFAETLVMSRRKILSHLPRRSSKLVWRMNTKPRQDRSQINRFRTIDL